MIELALPTTLQSEPATNGILWLITMLIILPVVAIILIGIVSSISIAIKTIIIRGLDTLTDLEYLKEETPFENSINKSLLSSVIAGGYWFTIKSPYVPQITVSPDTPEIATNMGEMIFIFSIMGGIGFGIHWIYLLMTKRTPNEKNQTNIN